MKKIIFGMLLLVALLLGIAGSEDTGYYYASDEEEWYLEIANEASYNNYFYEM